MNLDLRAAVAVFPHVVPRAPEWVVDWPAALRAFPQLQPLAACPQDTQFHVEGDVLTHTRLVCEALAADAAWRGLPDAEREALFLASLLHDVGKPDTTRQELDGRLATRGHARRGAILTRRLLWERGAPLHSREAIASLVRHHTAPFHLLDRPDPARESFAISYATRCDHLAMLARADARGRTCADPADQQRMLDAVALFEELCREHGCWDGPRAFPSDHARFQYFQTEGRDPHYRPHEAFSAQVTVMSGLPGAGKDHWVRTHLPALPVVSLDAIRAELGVAPTDDQRPVLDRAHEVAREHLRAGRSFVWNATNLSRQIRRECISYLAAYGARVRLVYVEAPPDVLFRQNRERAHPVPEAVIHRLLDRWEVPDLTEAHQVEWVAAI